VKQSEVKMNQYGNKRYIEKPIKMITYAFL
jgi:hypothetical protein